MGGIKLQQSRRCQLPTTYVDRLVRRVHSTCLDVLVESAQNTVGAALSLKFGAPLTEMGKLTVCP